MISIHSHFLQIHSDKLGKSIVADNRRSVRRILAAGVSPDCLVWRWDTALFLAVRLRRITVVRILLKAGASPNPGPRGYSPLADAARQGHSALIDLLLQHGAQIDQVPDDKNGCTSLEFPTFANRADLVTTLCIAGANPAHIMRNCFARAKWPCALPNPAVPNLLYLARIGKRPGGRMIRRDAAPCLIKRVPLFLAAIAAGADQAAFALLEEGADPGAKDSEGFGLADYRRLRRSAVKSKLGCKHAQF